MKKPLGMVHSIKSRIENAVTARAVRAMRIWRLPLHRDAQKIIFAILVKW